jgi:DNA replication protein DnaC
VTTKDIQDRLLAERDSQKWNALRARMAERGTPSLEKCPQGHYIATCTCACPNCKTCGGTGFVPADPAAKIGDPKYGQVDPCPNSRANYLKRALASGEMIGGLTAEEVQELSWNHVQPGISDAHKALPFVRESVNRGYGMGLMLGLWGQGKTLLMKIAVANFIRSGKRAHYIKLTKLLDTIRQTYDQKEGKMTALVNEIRKWENLDLLCLDELDKDADTDWAQSRLFDLVDERWVSAVRQQKLTLFAANYSSMGEVPGYLKSRIEDNRWAVADDSGKTAAFTVFLNGPDGRKAMPKGSRV